MVKTGVELLFQFQNEITEVTRHRINKAIEDRDFGWMGIPDLIYLCDCLRSTQNHLMEEAENHKRLAAELEIKKNEINRLRVELGDIAMSDCSQYVKGIADRALGKDKS